MVRESGGAAAEGIPVPARSLLYGPPGTEQRRRSRTLAKEAGVAFIARSTAAQGQYLGQADSRIAQSFECPCRLARDPFHRRARRAYRGPRQQATIRSGRGSQLLGDGRRSRVLRPCLRGGGDEPARRDRRWRCVRDSRSRSDRHSRRAGRTELLRVLLTGRPVAEAG